MIESYQKIRKAELGFPVGTGKRYTRKELTSFINASENEYKLFLEKTRFEERMQSYLESHGNHNIYRGKFNLSELSQFWSEAVNLQAITTPERLFYLGIDILRIRHASNWFDHIATNANRDWLIAQEQFKGPDRQEFDETKKEWIKKDLPPSKYGVYFYSPAFVSPNDYLSIIARGESLPDEYIEISRRPVSRKWSEKRNQFYDEKYAFRLGQPITIHYRSRFYDEEPNEYMKHRFGVQLHSLHELKLTPQQIQTFGRRLWEAHINTQVANVSTQSA